MGTVCGTSNMQSWGAFIVVVVVVVVSFWLVFVFAVSKISNEYISCCQSLSHTKKPMRSLWLLQDERLWGFVVAA